MKTLWSSTQIVFAWLGAMLGWLLGEMDGFLYALLVFVIADYLSGVMCAVVHKRLSSDIGFRGIFSKVMIFLLVGLGHILDGVILDTGSALRTAVIFFYLSNEGISLLENAAALGLPVPDKLKMILAQLKEKSGDAQ